MNEVAVELRNITKIFGDTIANDDVSLTVYKHEILSILGENGSVNTTLMNMVAGIYRPDSGKILIDGKEVPKDKYTVSKGSTVITISNSYLKTLQEGNHTIIAKIDNKEAEGHFTISM